MIEPVNQTTISASSLRVTAMCSDGIVREIIVDEAGKVMLYQLIAAMNPGGLGVYINQLNRRLHDKRLIVHAGIALDIVPFLVDTFLRDIEIGDSGDHMGRGRGMIISNAFRSYYVEQTETSVIVRYA